ncbi:hypothetical protein AGLY_016647 [Aphis glycines]|uniref:MULE transposase domain-containing protein n=1 Tax=Aphis glycines TaxID=307491 RepID=A0A6G0SXB4_APHGL|nr:hypothetical protein AGLY_016647 [Aphis glycines]
MSSEHNITVTIEHFTFDGENKFKDWKLEIEKETRSRYVRCSGQRKISNGSKIRKEFFGHRSFMPVVKTEGRKRALKSLSTNKISVACPSKMCVEIKGTEVNVDFIRLHLGHKCEVTRMVLSNDERACIAVFILHLKGKLCQGVPMDRIIQDIRNISNLDPEKFERIHYTEKKDLRNIQRDFKLGYHTMKLQEYDEVSVDILVHTLLEKEDTVILHYDKSDNHYNRICIDGTHGMNAKKPKIQLFTLLVVDEYGNEDTSSMILFFEKVKEAVGLQIKAEVFMSDDAPQFYNAWEQVMGASQYNLLNWWHVHKNWTANLNSKIKNKEKRELVKKSLYVLATDVENEGEFEVNLQIFLNELQEDEDTWMFYTYFRTNYINKKKCWAFCYRKHTGLNTNMHLENLHKKIKYTYLDGKIYIRLDKAIHKLFDLMRDVMFKRIIKIAKNKTTEKIRRIRDGHSKSLKIEDSYVSQDSENQCIWFVTSNKDPSHTYKVENLKKMCIENVCPLQCRTCNVCVHTYQCSCIDSRVYLNICKHIHKIGASRINETPIENEFTSIAIQGENEIIQTINLLEPVEITEDTISKSRQELVSKLQVMLGYAQSTNEDQIPNVLKYLDKALSYMKVPNVKPAEEENLNPLKKIIQQRDQYSEKKGSKKIQ